METPAPYPVLSLPAGATASLCFDVLRKEGLKPTAIGSPINPLVPYKPFIGRAFTVLGQEDLTLGEDESLQEWTRMLSKTPPNAVLVIQPGDHARSYMGELSANALTFRGCVGSVVDGPCRDSNQIIELGFPVFCQGSTPRDVVSAWKPIEYGQPVEINGHRVTSEDIIIGDTDGLTVTHSRNLDILLEKVSAALTSENLVRKAILAGEDPHSAYMKYRKF